MGRMQCLLRRVVGGGGGVRCYLTRRCGGPAQGNGTNAAGPSPPLLELPDALDMDETMTVSVYRPHGKEGAPQQDATRRFLHTIITSPGEQEWKDMLSAAIRLGTWREHHVRAVLRAVHQSQYDGGHSSGAASTPATRLHRALGIVRSAVDEGYPVAPESVHALLVILLRALTQEPAAAAGKTDDGPSPQGPLLADCAVIWQFLAWMERHNYHVMSTAVLEALEGVVDDGVLDRMSGERKSSVRQNRLEYLRNEHARLTRNIQSSVHGKEKGREARPMTTPDDE